MARVAGNFVNEDTLSRMEFACHVCRENVRLAVQAVRERSDILRTLESEAAIKIVEASYDLGSGEVSLAP